MVIRINELPEAANPVASQNVAIDGAQTERTTIQGLVDVGAPVASEAEARAGINNVKRMTALRVKQSMNEEIGNTIASAAQGLAASTALQPDDVATVATTGDYDDLSNKPTLGTAAAEDVADIVDLATAQNKTFPTRTDAESANIDAAIHSVSLKGDASEGDGLGGLFIDSDNGSTDTFESDDGRTWYRAVDVGISRIASFAVWTEGQKRRLDERARDTYCILDAPGSADPTGNNLSTTALLAMTAEANTGKGVKLDLLYGNYRIDQGLKFTKPVEIVGRGRGYWHPKPPSAGDGVSSEAPTQIVLTGTGPKSYTVHGVSSMAVSGGVVTNPSASLGNDAAYRLSSFENAITTATGRSRKAFSAGLWFAPGAAGSRLSGLRIIPDGGGNNGLDKYVIAGLATDDWAANWDVGFVVEMANQMLIKDVESVGHFRMMGELLLAVPANPADSAIPALWGVAHENVQTSGFHATEIRGADGFRCVAVGADYIEVPWADDHPFDPSAFNYIGYGDGSFTLGGSTTFTGLSKVGSNLRLTGVVAPGAITVGNHIYARRFGGGTSHVTWDVNCKWTGMNHQSGNVCHSSALGANAMPAPGAAFVASGWRMTELEVYGAIQTIEEVAVHVHSLAGSRIIPQLEGSGVKPSRIITSPTETDNTRVTNPAGRTQFCIIDSARGLKNETGVDARPVMNNASATSAYPSDPGLFSLAVTMEVPSMEFRKVDGNRSLSYDRSGGRNVLAAHLIPETDDASDLGSASNRLRNVISKQYRVGAGVAGIYGGTGSPQSVVSAAPGSIYLRDNPTGPDDLLYVKQTGTSSTGWVAAKLTAG